MLPAPSFYYDFYYISLFWHPGESKFVDREVTLILNRFRKKLVRDLLQSCFIELRHIKRCCHDYEKMKSPTPILVLNSSFLRRQNPDLVLPSIIHDFDLDWISQYGGQKWKTIAEATLELHRFRGKPTDLIITIDHTIDLCHNTGNVLNKLYPFIRLFLDRKKNSHEDILRYTSSEVRQLFR